MFCKAWKLRRKQSFHSGGLLLLNPLHCVASTSIQLIQCNTEQILAATFPVFGQHARKKYESVFTGLLLSSQEGIWEFLLWRNATGLVEGENVYCPVSVSVCVCACVHVHACVSVCMWQSASRPWCDSLMNVSNEQWGKRDGNMCWVDLRHSERLFCRPTLKLILDTCNTTDNWTSGCATG